MNQLITFGSFRKAKFCFSDYDILRKRRHGYSDLSAVRRFRKRLCFPCLSCQSVRACYLPNQQLRFFHGTVLLNTCNLGRRHCISCHVKSNRSGKYPFPSSEIRKLTSCISDVVSFYWVSDFYRADSFVLEICSICKFNVNTHFYFSLPDGSQVLSM